jgi:hypothetical protein
MRGFWDLVARGVALVRSAELAALLEPEELAALRAERVIQPSSPPGTPKHEAFEEISIPDLVRLARRLFGADPRGLTTPGAFTAQPQNLGWCGKGADERELVLVARGSLARSTAIHSRRRSLLLVITGQALTDAERKRHAPGAFLEVHALDEVLRVSDGRIVLAGSAPPDRDGATAAPRAEADKKSKSSAPVLPVPGVKFWNLVAIYLLNERTVHIDCGGRSYRRTYIDLGLAHGSRRVRTRVWELFVALLEGHGYLKTARFGSRGATKNLISRLRAALKAVFGLDDDPFYDYERERTWRTRFVAGPRPPAGRWEQSEDRAEEGET